MRTQGPDLKRGYIETELVNFSQQWLTGQVASFLNSNWTRSQISHVGPSKSKTWAPQNVMERVGITEYVKF